MGVLRILIADSHAEFRERVRGLLKARPDLAVCGEAADGEQLVAAARELKPDLIILDYVLPVIDGIEAVELIQQFLPGVLILLVSFHENNQLLSRAKSAGINGYVPKMKAAEMLLQAVDALLAGQSFFADPD
jgi:DNA-binding NarL/FixJ family response regulator